MPLTDTQCRTVKPSEKVQKLADGGGLFLQVTPKGQKYWRLKYRYLGVEKVLALGVYPIVTLAIARSKRDEAKKRLSDGEDPALEKKAAKLRLQQKAENNFESVAREWHAKQEKKLSGDYWRSKLHRLECDIFPKIGAYPIEDITSAQILSAIRSIEKRGAHEMARRSLQMCGQIFRYAIATGRCASDQTYALHGALEGFRKGHFASIESGELPELLRAVDRNDARLYPPTRNALRLMLLTFVRTGELIAATWDEINLDGAQWIIPAERMKMRRPYIVPLSRQAVEILREMRPASIEGRQRYLFPSQISGGTPHMSNNTILKALERMGYKGRMTGHGFRALAMTTIKEKLKYRHETVDRQLAHAPKNKIDAAYDRAQFLDERAEMMQKWADYLDSQS
jgi:integrase